MQKRNDAGETLVEIVITIVLMGTVISALLLALGNEARASRSHRDLATADTILRSYAEATKQAARGQCTSPGLDFTVTYTPPAPYAAPPVLTLNCPATASWLSVHLEVSQPVSKSMEIVVRTP